jgi:NAD(P)-dependent dehydrogenase (short-subunit alcohol dehydrogenase family)
MHDDDSAKRPDDGHDVQHGHDAEHHGLGAVIVTGGSSGLGAAVASKIADAGGTPIVLDVRPPAADVDHELVDLADTQRADAAVRRVAQRHALRGVVTCAGVDVPGAFTDVPRESWDRIVAINLLGTAAVVRAALPSLARNRGRVVTVASTLGHRAVGDATAYCASKFGVVGFTRALTAELRDRVGVTLLTPGGMHTAFIDDRDEAYKPPADAKLCDPADIADVVVFALSRPAGVDVKEVVVASPTESSWP